MPKYKIMKEKFLIWLSVKLASWALSIDPNDYLRTPDEVEELRAEADRSFKVQNEARNSFFKGLGIDRHVNGGKGMHVHPDGSFTHDYIDFISRNGKDETVYACGYCCDHSPDPQMFRFENIKSHIRGYQELHVNWRCGSCHKMNTNFYKGCLHCGQGQRPW